MIWISITVSLLAIFAAALNLALNVRNPVLKAPALPVVDNVAPAAQVQSAEDEHAEVAAAISLLSRSYDNKLAHAPQEISPRWFVENVRARHQKQMLYELYTQPVVTRDTPRRRDYDWGSFKDLYTDLGTKPGDQSSSTRELPEWLKN